MYSFEMMLRRMEYLTFLVILHVASDVAAAAAANGADDIHLKMSYFEHYVCIL